MAADRTDERCPALGHGDYLRFRRLVSDLYGLNFPEKRRNDLEQGIRAAYAASACEDLDGYYALLVESHDGGIHRQRLVNALTVGESHFFRDAGQFAALYDHILPDIIERRRPLRTLRVWSAGCSEGQEPYSIAIMLRELLPDIDDWAITIMGTDVNTAALERARRGLYSEWAFRESRALALRDRYFQRRGPKRYELLPEVRKMVTFTHLNLAENVYPAFRTNTTFLDLILCRNVIIYLSPAITQTVIQRFHEALVDGGWLAVGHAEHAVVAHPQLAVRNYPDAILYQRTGYRGVPDRSWLTPLVQATELPAASTPPVAETLPVDADAGATPADAIEAANLQACDPLVRAGELLEYGYVEQARDLLLAQLDHDGHDAAAAALLGQAYANLGAWEEAQLWCEYAIGQEQLNPDPYYILALVFQHQGQLNEALRTMRKAVYLDSSSIHGQYGLANLHYSLGQLPQALKALDNARRLLMGYSDGDILPQTGGITAGVMRQAITQHLQLWSAEAIGARS